jgi:hypothetical protein
MKVSNMIGSRTSDLSAYSRLRQLLRYRVLRQVEYFDKLYMLQFSEFGIDLVLSHVSVSI